MKLKSCESMNCPLAQTLEVVGERWTLLVLRDVFFGARRFDDIQANLGIARNILTLRLQRLVAEGVLERRRGERGRHEYVLTEKGLDLQPVLLSLAQWGERHRPHPDGARLQFVERATGLPIAAMGARSEDGRLLQPKDIRATPGPALHGGRTEGEGAEGMPVARARRATKAAAGAP
jgi:DNA-binding HxlR family transcriptional regulator